MKSLLKRPRLDLLLTLLIGGSLLPNAMLAAPLLSQAKSSFYTWSSSGQALGIPVSDDYGIPACASPGASGGSSGPVQLDSEALSESGLLDPRPIEQSATCAWEGEDLRTDTNPAPAVDLPVDRAHDWVGSQVNVEVSDLRRLHTTNGTFDAGVNGTNVDGVGTAHPTSWHEAIGKGGDPAQCQRTAYSDLTGVVMVENEGTELTDSRFSHASDAYVSWNQTIHLSRLTSQFHLRFNYLYSHGPIGGYRSTIYVCVWFGYDWVWRQDLTYTSVRNQWFDTGLLGINWTVSSTFNFRIGLYVSSDVTLAASNPACNGQTNARFLTLFLDNVSLTAAAAPYPSEVFLQAHVPEVSSLNLTDVGPGQGSGLIAHEYWETPTVTVAFTANCSIIFDCLTILRVLRTKYSVWQLGSGVEGVAFAVVNGSSVNLTLWTDVAYPAVYSNFEFTLIFPADWENVTIFDSYPSDVTSQCTVLAESILVSGSTAEQLGWWHVTFQARNYAKSGAVQIFASGVGSWRNETVFRCVDEVRALGSIGTDSVVPDPMTSVTVTWQYPNGTLWAQEILEGDADGCFSGLTHWLGRGNTTAGAWAVQILWGNGTEIAFRAVGFGLYHAASLSPCYIEESTEPGNTIMGAVDYWDSDTNQPILDVSALILANWSTTSISLAPNPVQRRWEGVFNTDIVGLGVHVVRVNASHPFLDEAHCYFTVLVNYRTQLASPNEPWDQTEWGTVKVIELVYKYYNQTSRSWQGVDNATRETRVTCNWTKGFWTVQASDGRGSYRLAINTAALPSGTWHLNITIVRPGYGSQELAVTLLAFVVRPETRLAWLVPVLVAALLIVVFGLLVSRLVRRRRAAQQVMLLASRQEFEDARNIVTVIILNRSTGMPIYSSYSRQGPRNELLAAFVSAISHFRQEIVAGEQEELFRLIPISDVVHICASRTLLCVLVTLMPPSERLKVKLVEFGKTLDRDFDDLLHQREGVLVEDIIASTLHEVVQKAFGLRLLAPHVTDPSQHVPRRLRQVVRTAETNFPQAGIDLVQLSRYLQAQGQREKVAYNLILQAVRKGVLVALPPGPTLERGSAPSKQH